MGKSGNGGIVTDKHTCDGRAKGRDTPEARDSNEDRIRQGIYNNKYGGVGIVIRRGCRNSPVSGDSGESSGMVEDSGQRRT